MILLLEGTSGTGKSSLARRLGDALNLPILKFAVPPEGAFEHFSNHLNAFAEAHPHGIVDRCHLSNWACNGSEGGGVLSYSEWLGLDDWFKRHQTWLFLMVGDPREIQERLLKRDGESPSVPEIGALQLRFLEAFDMSGIEVKGTFDYGTFLMDEHFDHLVHEIKKVMN